jgi:hypothetical protein
VFLSVQYLEEYQALSYIFEFIHSKFGKLIFLSSWGRQAKESRTKKTVTESQLAASDVSFSFAA